ncbi:MAG: YbbR-like domain-containing protein [Chitinophagales bacterium]|nr:YbbR-like domain-containing protein [Chitinophagales bacterium]
MFRQIFHLEDRTAFLFCLLVAMSMWLLNKLTETYTVEVAVPVTYLNLPEDSAPAIPLPNRLHLTVRGMGIDLIKQLKWRKNQATIDYLKNTNRSHQTATDNLISSIEAQFDDIRIADIKPDTIHWAFDRRITRKVPIKISADIETASHFELQSVRATQPDSVSVTGAAVLIDTLKYWQTKSLVMRDMSQSTSGEIRLQTPQNGVSLSTNSTHYQVKIEEYTEKSIDVAIQTANLPPKTQVFLYPRTATVYFQVISGAFNDIDSSYFEVKADFANYDIAQNNRIDIAVSKAPAGIRNLRAEPTTAEYIIIE